MIRTLLVCYVMICGSSSVKADDYYCMLFSHQNQGNPRPRCSHTWASFLKTTECKGIIEEFTISWIPKGRMNVFGNKVRGRNRTLHESVISAKNRRFVVDMWGPYKIKESYYKKAKRQFNRLNTSGLYKALDRHSRFHKRQAVNCIHAVSDIGGILRTRTLFGRCATEAIVYYFKQLMIVDKKENYDWILDKLDLRKYCLGRR